MSDLIERQAAIDALEKVAELYPWRVPGDSDSYSQYNEAWQDALNRVENEIEALPSAQPFHNTTMDEVLKYIDDMTEDEWQEFTACLECRGWELQRRTAKWCGSDFA